MSGDPIVPVVIDTNVLVPSLYSYTPIAQFILAGNLVLIWNKYIYDEVNMIINKLANRYRNKAGVEPEEVITLLDLVTYAGIRVPEMPDDWPPVSTDRKDDPFLWAAMVGNADYIISDDRLHMLKLKSFKGITIGRPGSFFKWVINMHPMTSKYSRRGQIGSCT